MNATKPRDAVKQYSKPRAEKPTLQSAKQYVDQQLKIMKKYGGAPSLSRSDYERLVKKVEKASRV